MAIDSFWLHLLAKMLASALVVVIATLTAEKAGPFWGALIASLPVAAGPIYVVLGIEHGADFLATSAIGSIAATTATAAYMLSLTLICPHAPVLAAIPLAMLAWIAAISAISLLTWDLVSASALTTGALLIGMSVTRHERSWSTPAAAARRWYDIPSRAILVAVVVGLVTSFSATLGAEATGLLAVFPIAMTSLALIIFLRQGGRAVATIMANSFLPMIGFVSALATLHMAAPFLGVAGGMAAALGVSIVWSAVLIVCRVWSIPGPGRRQTQHADTAQQRAAAGALAERSDPRRS